MSAVKLPINQSSQCFESHQRALSQCLNSFDWDSMDLSVPGQASCAVDGLGLAGSTGWELGKSMVPVLQAGCLPCTHLVPIRNYKKYIYFRKHRKPIQNNYYGRKKAARATLFLLPQALSRSDCFTGQFFHTFAE